VDRVDAERFAGHRRCDDRLARHTRCDAAHDLDEACPAGIDAACIAQR